MTFKDYIDRCTWEELEITNEWGENLENITNENGVELSENGKMIERVNDD